MPVLGITGGIATGKSTFARALLQYLPAELFDADLCARELLESDATVRQAVREAFGEDILDAHGDFDRARLRARVFANESERRQLEAILHPAIRRHWTAQAESSTRAGRWLCVDIPLLFETKAESHFDRVIVVACSPGTQRRRLREARGLDDAIAEKIIGAQLDLRVKMEKADHVIWNDSTTASLEGQAALLAGWLRKRHE
jgi:dephospho-CoA kinase